MYIAADRYTLPSLAAAAREGLKASLSKELPLHPHHYTVPSPENLHRLLEIIPSVYSSTNESNRDLRAIVAKTAVKYWLSLKQTSKEELRKVMREVPDFAWDLLGGILNDDSEDED